MKHPERALFLKIGKYMRGNSTQTKERRKQAEQEVETFDINVALKQIQRKYAPYNQNHSNFIVDSRKLKNPSQDELSQMARLETRQGVPYSVSYKESCGYFLFA
jgi:hypothetical protein